MDIIFFVYILTFANGKVYVGMSRTDAKGRSANRYRQHALAAKNGKRSPVYNAWRKHGAPVQSILSTHADRNACALAEIDAIQTYDSMNPACGYNIMAGGEGLHAPPGSAAYELMRAKVWNNPAWREKVSVALKGRPVSDATRVAQAAWIQSDEAKARIAAVARHPETRAANSARMKQRLEDPEYRAWLSANQLGKPKNISAEGRARIVAGRESYAASERGKEGARRGAAIMRANPENLDKRRRAHAAYLASGANKALCQANAARACKGVREVATGRTFASQKDAAAAFGVSRPTVNYWVRTGRFEHVTK